MDRHDAPDGAARAHAGRHYRHQRAGVQGLQRRAQLGGRELVHGLPITRRSNTYVSAHVPEELARHLADVAKGHPEIREAERVLWDDIMPLVPVVDLAVGDHLHPRIQAVRRADPGLPLRLRGNPDDLGTVALAEFLAPAVIISADSVFTRFGLANSVADTWLPLAHGLLQAAGYEATLTEAAFALELAAG